MREYVSEKLKVPNRLGLQSIAFNGILFSLIANRLVNLSHLCINSKFQNAIHKETKLPPVCFPNFRFFIIYSST